MSDWAEGVAWRYREKRQEELLWAEKSILDRRTLDRKGILLWGELRAALAHNCAEFNKTPGNKGRLSLFTSQDNAICKVAITGDHRRIVGTWRDNDFSFEGEGGITFNEWWHINLTKDCLDVWIADKNNCPVTVKEIAQAVVEGLLF